jgi:prepilin peptidase CpaA
LGTTLGMELRIMAQLTIERMTLLVFVCAVALIDMGGRRIPNLLTVTAAALGFGMSVAVAGTSGAIGSASGLLVGLGVFLPFYLARGMGAGDVKAMAAIGAFLGPQGALLAAAWSLVAGAISAVILLLAMGGYAALRALAQRFALRFALGHFPGATAGWASPGERIALHRFPYGLAIACGTVTSLGWS